MERIRVNQFEKANTLFRTLGYQRVEMRSEGGIINYLSYERPFTTATDIHRIEFHKFKTGGVLVVSSNKDNGAVGLTRDELFTVRRMLKALRWNGQPIWLWELRKIFYTCLLSIKELFLSFTQINQIHLMDHVWFQGEQWFVSNGTRCSAEGEQLWSIYPRRTLPDGTRTGLQRHVTRDSFRRVFCWRNITNALFSHYRWWRTYWRDIHVEQCLRGEYKNESSRFKHSQ